MAKHHQDPLLEALKQGQSHTWTVPEGGYLASMRKAIKHGQTLTMSPIHDPDEIQVGDMVLVKWHQSDIFHIVGEIADGQYLIVNSLGKVNGWVGPQEILGRITQVIEPEPRPDVPELLEQLALAYQDLVQGVEAGGNDANRLHGIVDDLRWYAERIGAERWDVMPRSNQWSFHQNLWRLTRQAHQAREMQPNPLHSVIDQGKICVGLAGEIVASFETSA